MALLPDFPPAMPGEIDFYSVSFASRLATGETISSVQAAVRVWDYSAAQDVNASGVLIGAPFISGASVVAICGGAYAAAASGFQPGVTYLLGFEILTSNNRTLREAGNIPVQPYTLPAFGGGSPAPSQTELTQTASFTPSRPATYYLNAAGLTLTVPTGSVGGDIVVIDRTGAPDLTISGLILNAPPNLSPIIAGNFAFTLRWSALYAGYFILGN